MKNVRLGIIGCGGMSRHHGRMLTTETRGAQIVALCDPLAENLQRYQREIFDPLKQTPPTFADYREMLEKVELDGVVIVTPHDQHYEQAVAALDAGCHVLLEKPMVIGVSQARKLIQHVKARKRILTVGLQGTFCAEYAHIREMIKSGAFGELRTVDAFVTQNWKRGTAGKWRQDPVQAGGGFAFDTGAHLFHAMLYIPDLRPVTVLAHTDNRGAPVEIVMSALIHYENDAVGTATLNGDSVKFDEGIHLAGTRAAARTSLYGNRLEVWDAKGQLVRYPAVKAVPSMYQNFVDCIRGRAETKCPPVWGLRQALLMDALYKSARTGKPVNVARE